MSPEVTTINNDIIEVGKLMYDRGYVVSNDGNISVRVGEDRVIITPSGVSKGRMTVDMLVITDLDGNIVEGDRYPSSEIKMHLKVYQNLPEVKSVVHAHPPKATAFAICRTPLDRRYMPEMLLSLGEVQVADFAIPSTDEVPESIVPHLKGNSALLLANHGVLTWAENLWAAFDLMETVEYTAKMYQNVASVGKGIELSDEEVKTLFSLSGFYKKLAGKRTN